jgi:hypothetical protein
MYSAVFDVGSQYVSSALIDNLFRSGAAGARTVASAARFAMTSAAGSVSIAGSLCIQGQQDKLALEAAECPQWVESGHPVSDGNWHEAVMREHMIKPNR